MKPCLADVNVWLALLAARHVHHHAAREWFDTLAAGEGGICRFVQLALIRLLGNHAVMGADAVSAAAAWDVIARLLEDERVEMLAEPPGIDAILHELFRYPVPTSKLVGDAWLAAFAISAGRTIVTVDRGFQQFRGLKLKLLDAA